MCDSSGVTYFAACPDDQRNKEEDKNPNKNKQRRK